jgi:hypothetical protein
MDPEKMLSLMSAEGEDAGADYNDGEADGWFGWAIAPGKSGEPVLTITHEPWSGHGKGDRTSRRWMLVALIDGSA